MIYTGALQRAFALAASNSLTSYWNAGVQIVFTILALILVLFLAYVVLRWMNKRMPGLGGGQGRAIQVIDRVSVGRSGVLVLVRVENKVILIAISDHAAQNICEFDDPDKKIGALQDVPPVNFSSALKDAVGRFGKGTKNDGGDGKA